MGSYPRCAPRSGRCEGRQGVVCVRVCLARASVGLIVAVTAGLPLADGGDLLPGGGGVSAAMPRRGGVRRGGLASTQLPGQRPRCHQECAGAPEDDWTARARGRCCCGAEPLGSPASTRPNAAGGSPGLLRLESYHVSASYLSYSQTARQLATTT
eukprot:COSAG01_NODE_17_length_39991_cov_30.596160_24_plen_155_part_00